MIPRPLIVANVMALLLVACVPGEPIDPIGVAPVAGGLEILLRACDDSVASLEVVESADFDVDARDQRLWKVVAPNPREIDSVIIGRTPPGYKEEVPLLSPLPRDAILVAEAETRKGGKLTIDFILNKLRAGKVWYFNRNIAREKFERETACA